MTIETGKAPIAAIQSLRGIAAFMVVLVHLAVQTDRLGFPPVNVSVMNAGVDIFFVISGFIMWVTTATRPERTAASFYRDRIARVVPLYWLITGFLLAILLVAPQLTQTVVLDAKHAILSFLFLPAASPINGSYTPLLIPGWTLNYEMFFYLLFGLAMALAPRNLKLRAALIVAPLILLALAGWLFNPQGVLSFYLADIVLEFALGIGIAIIYLRGGMPRSLGWWVVAALGASFLALSSFSSNEELRAVKWGLPAAMIVAGCVFAPPLRLRYLEKLGDWSYSLYLSHPIILSAAFQAWRPLGGALPLWLFPLFAVIACIAASAVLYRCAEMPLLRGVKALLNPHRQGRTVSAGAGEATDRVDPAPCPVLTQRP